MAKREGRKEEEREEKGERASYLYLCRRTGVIFFSGGAEAPMEIP